MKPKIVVFSGAGVSQESNIPTFRDSDNGLYLNKSIEEAFSVQGWKADRGFVLDVHNELRRAVMLCEPNEAHKLIAGLEELYDVTVVTQNLDHLHEKAGSTNVLHLHGEILKSRSTLNHKIYDIDGTELCVGDKCPAGSQMRPHSVLFGEEPYNIQEAYDALSEADILIIIGTSLSITYTIPLLGATSAYEIYYIDPNPSKDGLEWQLEKFGKIIPEYIKKKATEGMAKLYKKLMK
jgi:NAD-dependent deacetylase